MKQRMQKTALFALGFLVLVFYLSAAPAALEAGDSAPTTLYRISFVRAAPGKLLDLIELFKNRMSVYDAMGDEPPLWWRHTQGDQWDLMMIFPMESYAAYYAEARIARRAQADEHGDDFMRRFNECTAWKEDLFVMGPSLAVVKEKFQAAAYYHIEIFVSLPGKQKELYQERVMENKYQVGIGRPATLIFTRDQGASWDLFTLGCYRDLHHWAESYKLGGEKREAAARAAGFENSAAIGPYMRSLIYMHRDTMGVAIR